MLCTRVLVLGELQWLWLCCAVLCTHVLVLGVTVALASS